MTTSFLPEESLSGWLATVAKLNPVTYLLEGMRSVITGWDTSMLLPGIASIAGVMIVSFSLALLTLRGRLRRGA